jgi:NAD-dependent DNA ligase
MAEERDDLDYEIDGIVVKLDDLAARRAMGSTSHHPRWALAYKFEPRQEVTRIDKIDVQVGRTGVLTPVAFLRPWSSAASPSRAHRSTTARSSAARTSARATSCASSAPGT